MASTPRYVGTDATTAKAYVLETLGPSDFLRVFDVDGDGAVASASDDEKAFVRAVCAAETEVDEHLAASHGAPFDGEIASGSADETAFVRAVCSAETEVDEALAASHGAPFTGVVPDSVREIAALRSLWCAVRTRALNDAEKAPFRVLYKDTDARLARLATDNRGRIPERGAVEPTASIGSVEAAPMPWTDAVNRSSWSGF